MRKPNQSSHRISAYIRVSTEEQAENPEGSIKNQEERIRQTVKLKNMEGPFGEITEVYVDRARSGKDTNRPELQRLLAAIRRKEVTLLIVTELSRLSRSIKDFAQIWELMQACGCQFMSLRENFDTTTAAGEMVLYSVANIAQFERRQVSERVAANFQARASRGLYNGGVLPIGYKLIPDRPGFLAIDEDGARVVRTAFETLLAEGDLCKAAKALNRRGIGIPKTTQGGFKKRHGRFTWDNLRHLVSNKSYLGIRTFQVRGEARETKAAWDPIVSPETFKAVQDLLTKNKKRKPESESRFPFLLSGLVKCESCDHHMVGKSAHGNSGKVPYYEHGWATKLMGAEIQGAMNCNPFRILAKKLEPLVWEKIESLLTDPATAKLIIDEATEIHRKRSRDNGRASAETKIQTITAQIDVLAERLASLPATVSPGPIYKQLERLEAAKNAEEKALSSVNEGVAEKSTELSSYNAFIEGLRKLRDTRSDVNSRIAQALIHRVAITADGFNLHFYAGQDHIPKGTERLPVCSNVRREKGLASHDLSQSASHAEPGWRERGLGMDMDVRASGKDRGKEGPLLVYGSNRLTNGG